MRTKSDEAIGAIAVAVLLILTAWGNALAMLIVSGLGLLAALVFRRRHFQGSALVVTVGCLVSGLLATGIVSANYRMMRVDTCFIRHVIVKVLVVRVDAAAIFA